MSVEIAILAALTLLLVSFFFFLHDETTAFFILVGIRLLAEPLGQYGLGIGFNPIGLFGVGFITYSLIVIFLKKNSSFSAPIIRFYYLFLFLALFSIFGAKDYLLFIIYFTRYTAMASIFLISYNLFHDVENVTRGLRYFIMISVPPILYSLYQLMTGGGQHAQIHIGMAFDKLTSTFSHPNNFAFYLALVIFALLIMFQLPVKRKPYYYIIFTLAVISLIFTYSRSTWLSVISCTFISFFAIKKGRIPILLMAIIVSIGFTPLILYRFTDVTEGIARGDLLSGSSLGFRLNLAKILLYQAFPDKPWFGFGLGSSMKVAGEYASMTTPPHNEYLRVLIETGTIGIFGYFLFLCSYLFFLIRNFKYLGKNAFYTGLIIIFIFYCGITFGTNAFGGISSGGMWFCLLGILLKGFILTSSDTERRVAVGENNTIQL